MSNTKTQIEISNMSYDDLKTRLIENTKYVRSLYSKKKNIQLEILQFEDDIQIAKNGIISIFDSVRTYSVPVIITLHNDIKGYQNYIKNYETQIINIDQEYINYSLEHKQISIEMKTRPEGY